MEDEEVRYEWNRTVSSVRTGTAWHSCPHVQTQGQHCRHPTSADQRAQWSDASAHHAHRFLLPAETAVKVMPVSASFRVFPASPFKSNGWGFLVLFYATLNTYLINMDHFFMPLCLSSF